MVTINGENFDGMSGITIFQLLEKLEFTPSRVVVEKNKEIIARSDFENIVLQSGDRLEVLNFVGGG